MGICSEAFDHLSIHVKFTAIVSGAYLGEAKMCLKTLLRQPNASTRKTCEGNDIPA